MGLNDHHRRLQLITGERRMMKSCASMQTSALSTLPHYATFHPSKRMPKLTAEG
jgi:hypothetical protein